MPQNGFNPNEPGYYIYDGKKPFDPLTNMLGRLLPTELGEEKSAQALASEENYRAYVLSRMPVNPSDEEAIETVIEKAPEMKVDESEQDERRELSEMAREAIANASVNKVFGEKGRWKYQREDAVFYKRGTSKEAVEANDKIEKRLKESPEERGRLLEERIKDSMALYNRFVAGEITDRELVENFEKIHEVFDLVSNAEKILDGTKPDKNNQVYFTASEETKNILRDMEQQSTKMYLFVNKIRIMANPNYEFLKLENIVDMNEQTYEDVNEYASMDSDDPILEDAFYIAGTDRPVKAEAAIGRLRKMIYADFPEEEARGARMRFAGIDGELHEMGTAADRNESTIRSQVLKTNIKVKTPSGETVWYHVDVPNGTAKRIELEDTVKDAGESADKVLADLKRANKGLFIGSKEYSNVLKDMEEKVCKSVKELGESFSPENREKAAEQLTKVLEECNKYLKRKGTDPDNHYRTVDEVKADMSPREKSRFNAMEKVAVFCKTQLYTYELQREQMEPERYANSANLEKGKEDLYSWYSNFKDEVYLHADLDISSEKDAARVKNFEIKKWDPDNIEGTEVEATYAFIPGGAEKLKTAPGIENPEEHLKWVTENLRTHLDLEGIRRLYNQSRAGTLMVFKPGDGHHHSCQAYTDEHGKIIISAPISHQDPAMGKNLTEDQKIPLPPERVAAPRPEDYFRNYPQKPAMPQNMHPGFWSRVGHRFGIKTDYTKVVDYNKAMEDYDKAVKAWEKDIEKQPGDLAGYRKAQQDRQEYLKQITEYMATNKGRHYAIDQGYNTSIVVSDNGSAILDLEKMEVEYMVKQHEEAPREKEKKEREAAKAKKQAEEMKKLQELKGKDAWKTKTCSAMEPDEFKKYIDHVAGRNVDELFANALKKDSTEVAFIKAAGEMMETVAARSLKTQMENLDEAKGLEFINKAKGNYDDMKAKIFIFARNLIPKDKVAQAQDTGLENAPEDIKKIMDALKEQLTNSGVTEFFKEHGAGEPTAAMNAPDKQVQAEVQKEQAQAEQAPKAVGGM